MQRRGMGRRTFLSLSAATVGSVAVAPLARATVPKPYSWDASPPMDNVTAFVKWMQEHRGEDPRYLRQRFERFQNMVGEPRRLGRPQQAGIPADPARGILPAPQPAGDLRRQLSRHRLRGDDHGTARGRSHDQLDRRQDGREGARDRHRLGLPIRLSLQPHRQGLVDRDHQAVGRAHARPLRRPHRARLHRVQDDRQQACRRLLRLGGGRAVRQDHRHLRHRPHPAAAAAGSSRPAASW